MRLKIERILFAICVLSFSSMTSVRAQQNGVTKDNDVVVTQFKDLDYPAIARSTHTQGAAVVEAKLDDQGGVIDAVALSGPSRLTPAALGNVKLWRFRPNASKSVVIVY